MRFSIFRRTPNQRFNHIPIYYDPNKERLEELEANAKVDLGVKKKTDYHETMKGSMHRYAHQHRSATTFANNEKKKSNIRIVVILSILFGVAYLLLKHTETFVEAFMKR